MKPMRRNTISARREAARRRVVAATAALKAARAEMAKLQALPSDEKLALMAAVAADGRLKKLAPRCYTAPHTFFSLCITPPMIAAADDAGLLVFPAARVSC